MKKNWQWCIGFMLGVALVYFNINAATLGPIGGRTNKNFDHRSQAASLGPITEIAIAHGDVLDGFDVVYGSARLSMNPPIKGNGNGRATFSANDPLVEVSGIYGNYFGGIHLAKVFFKSRSGKKFGPFGSGSYFSSSKPFSLKANENESIQAFFGGHLRHSDGSTFLSSLGAITSAREKLTQKPEPVRRLIPKPVLKPARRFIPTPAPKPIQVPIPMPAPEPAPVSVVTPVLTPTPVSIPVAVVPAKPDYSIRIQKVRNRINLLKEESDRLRNEIESLKQALASLASGQENPEQINLNVCQSSNARLAKRLAFIDEDRQQLQNQLQQALAQIQALSDRIKQGEPVTVEVIEEKAPLAAVPVAELFVPAAEASKQDAVSKAKKKKKSKKAKKSKKPKSKKSKKSKVKKMRKKKGKSAGKIKAGRKSKGKRKAAKKGAFRK